MRGNCGTGTEAAPAKKDETATCSSAYLLFYIVADSAVETDAMIESINAIDKPESERGAMATRGTLGSLSSEERQIWLYSPLPSSALIRSRNG